MKDPKQPKGNVGPKTDPAPGANASRGRQVTRAEGKASRRADALFKALSTDYLLREQFVTDPAQIMAEYISGQRLPGETSDVANQLLYSVMSNPRLRDWMAQYSRHLNGATPTRHAFAVQFARAVSVRGDGLTALALIRGAVAGRESFVVQADLLRAFITVIGGHLGSSGTEMSPGGGTEVSPGGGTEMSPGAIFSGTEMSPGGGTEISPGGTGTEMSPGALGAGHLPGYLQVTLNALVSYAGQLRARGALFSSGLEGR